MSERQSTLGCSDGPVRPPAEVLGDCYCEHGGAAEAGVIEEEHS